MEYWDLVDDLTKDWNTAVRMGRERTPAGKAVDDVKESKPKPRGPLESFALGVKSTIDKAGKGISSAGKSVSKGASSLGDSLKKGFDGVGSFLNKHKMKILIIIGVIIFIWVFFAVILPGMKQRRMEKLMERQMSSGPLYPRMGL